MGDKLLGLLIVQTDEGFYVVSTGKRHEDRPNILAKAGALLSEKPPLLKFNFPFEDVDTWGLDVDTINDTSPDPLMSGRWVNPDDPAAEDDVWVATGSGKGAGGDEEAEAAAASY
jgi:hypothetical protein